MLSGEAAKTKFSLFLLTRLAFELTLYRTRGKYANHYTTGSVFLVSSSVYIYLLISVSFHGCKQSQLL